MANKPPQAKDLTPEDIDECNAMAMSICDDAAAGRKGPVDDIRKKMADAFKSLRAVNVSWLDILSKIQQIMSVLQSGGSWQDTIKRIIDIFYPPTPAHS